MHRDRRHTSVGGAHSCPTALLARFAEGISPHVPKLAKRLPAAPCRADQGTMNRQRAIADSLAHWCDRAAATQSPTTIADNILRLIQIKKGHYHAV